MEKKERIPLLSLNGTDWQAHEHLHKLESHLSFRNTVAFNSVQTALVATLELLGTRTHMHPVVLPVTAPPDVISATLRSGGHPLLLDIEEKTLQMRPEQVQEALSSLEAAIVILTRPGGMPVSEELLELVEDYPTVLDARLVPHNQLGMEDLVATFNVYDFTQLSGNGAAVIHKFPKQVNQLRVVRSGIMGHNAAMSEGDAHRAHAELTKLFDSYCETYTMRVEEYRTLLEEATDRDILLYDGGKWPSPLYIRVPNARKVVAHLDSFGFEAALGCFPLYNLGEIRMRYQEDPDYPYADALSNQIVALPTHLGTEGLVSEICKRILEVT